MTDRIQYLTDSIRETAFALHKYLRNGLLEKVYENGLANCLRKQGIAVMQQYPLTVRGEDGAILGDYFAELFIEDRMIVELKAVERWRTSISLRFSLISARRDFSTPC